MRRNKENKGKLGGKLGENEGKYVEFKGKLEWPKINSLKCGNWEEQGQKKGELGKIFVEMANM